MKYLKLIELSDLFDLLIEQTAQYRRMVSVGAATEQLENCREMITEIQSEIECRKAGKHSGHTPKEQPLLNISANQDFLN